MYTSKSNLFISESQYVGIEYNKLNCTETICESNELKNYYFEPLVLRTYRCYLPKFQILGTDNCSDCGNYTIKFFYEKKI